MNIIFLTLVPIRDDKQTDIYSSLMREFTHNGHDVYVVSPVEKRENKKLEKSDFGKMHLLYAYIGNYFSTGWVEKGLTTVTLGKQYKKVIYEELSDKNIDLILYSTPPVTLAPVIKALRKKYKASTYLMLKDIWPQSMADMEILYETGLYAIMYRYFAQQEKQMYLLSDYIGCMSPACANYVIIHYPYIDKNQVELCPNAINFDDDQRCLMLTEVEKEEIRREYNIPHNKVVFVFGGNIGNGHDPGFLEECIRLNEKRTDTYMLFVGRGIYYKQIKRYIETNKMKNAGIIANLPQQEYLKLMSACDVGMITLDHRFTCPNYPSRLMSYLVVHKPVIIAQDEVSDVGPIAEENGYGYWCASTNPTEFVSLMDNYLDEGQRTQMGEKGYRFLKENYNTKKVYATIMRHFKEV